MRTEIERLRQTVEQLMSATGRLSEVLRQLQPTGDVVAKLDEINRLLREQNLYSDLWEFVPIDVDELQDLGVGENKVILSKKEKGMLIAVGAVVTSGRVLVKIKVDELVIQGTPEQLDSYGLVGYNPRTFWISKSNSQYTIWLTPIPYLQYNNEIKVSVTNLDTTAVQYSYSIYRYRYKG